jgi:hypothetical protein
MRSLRSTLALSRLLGALLLASLAGCGHHFELQSPADFAELDPDAQARRGFAQRAVSADGVVVAVREVDNDRHASRAFWLDAVRNRVRRSGGYALLSESSVRSADGAEGHQLRFGRDEGQRPYDYWVTLFVTESHVFVIEAGGRREHFEARRAAVEQTIASFRLR